ncbi:hypothetical protein V7793_06855 [Streptomyces sp. KLMMK]|uniref:hypothetical protein n=1 Tax=Streptomyces sp. KLMMK TaxID=3109353 RepID=UPI002FFFBB3A
MARRGKTARRLVVGGATYMWSIGHTHHVLGGGRYEGCCETLVVRLFKARGRLRVSFATGPGRLVPDGRYMPSGAVGTTDGRTLNLNEPGTVRALLDEALGRGWRPDDPPVEELDGWSLFDVVAARRGAAPREQPAASEPGSDTGTSSSTGTSL